MDASLGVTVSTANRMATLGSGVPSAWATSIALRTMSAFSSSVGAMLMAASVISSGLG